MSANKLATDRTSSGVTEVLANMRILWGANAVLEAGDLIPVWDLKAGKLVTPFEAQLLTAVRYEGKLISQAGDGSPRHNAVVELFDAFNSMRDNPQVMERVARLQDLQLKNMGGRRVVRPDAFPAGVIPGEHRRNTGRVFEHHAVSVFDFVAETRDTTETDELIPLPRFYVSSGAGYQEGRDVSTNEVVEVSEIPLPFSWLTLREMGLVDRQEFAADMLAAEIDVLATCAGSVRQARWDTIYMGYGLPGLNEWDAMVPSNSTTQTYVLPYRNTNRWEGLQNAAGQKADVLMRGKPPTARVAPVTTAGAFAKVMA